MKTNQLETEEIFHGTIHRLTSFLLHRVLSGTRWNHNFNKTQLENFQLLAEEINQRQRETPGLASEVPPKEDD